jgi:hypothetical protein
MISKRVLILTAVIALFATAAFADYPGAIGFQGALNLGPEAAPTSTLDLINTSALIYSTPSSGAGSSYDGVRQYLMAGFDGSAWDGKGIMGDAAMNSSTAGNLLYGYGIMTTADYVSYNGNTFYGVTINQPAQANWTVAKMTYMGDCDLNGFINGDDLFYVQNAIQDQNLGHPDPLNWANGNLDYNSILNGDDLFYVQNVIQYQNLHGILPTFTSGGAGITPVPEPSLAVLLLVSLASFIGYKKLWK